MKKKLVLVRETLVSLTSETLDGVVGGASVSTGGGLSQTQASLCMPPGASDPNRTKFFCMPDPPQ